MPEISRFLGISIRMYRDEHLPPRVLGYLQKLQIDPSQLHC
jgi:hypothetical protein